MPPRLGDHHTFADYRLVGDLYSIHEGYFWRRRYGFIVILQYSEAVSG